MKKEWLCCLILIFLLTGCTTDSDTEQTPPVRYGGPTETITGAEPKYEPYSPIANHDYSSNGVDYQIITDPQNYSQRGLASWYSETQQSNRTAIGETFDPLALAAAHPTLPIPSYVRVTNLNNNRRLIVRVNDRGPFIQGRIIKLTKGVTDRLNLTEQSPVQVDFITVTPDGTLSGPGTVGTEFAKQNFALPGRPEIAVVPTAPIINSQQTENSQGIITPEPINQEQSNQQATPGPTHTQQPANQFKQATKQPGEYDQYRLPGESTPAHKNSTTAQKSVTATQQTATAGAGLMLQVGALSNETRAEQWQKELSQQFSLPGRVKAEEGLYRVQIGPFSSREQATAIQQKLLAAQINSFVVTE